MSDLRPIGVFDSGVGGLSVLRAMRTEMPTENVVYFGDQSHVPYGPRPMAQIQEFSWAITNFLIELGAKLIVVACNTASAAALQLLRSTHPEIAFVGMEPAVKPAVEQTRTGKVGVLATPATFQGELYGSVLERFASGVTVLQDTCPGLVGQIEKGDLTGPVTREILEQSLRRMVGHGIDTVVLGCTHYPFVIPLIREVAGPSIRVIDPAPAVARQVARVLRERGIQTPSASRGTVRFITSGSPTALQRLLPLLMGEAGVVEPARWRGDSVLEMVDG